MPSNEQFEGVLLLAMIILFMTMLIPVYVIEQGLGFNYFAASLGASLLMIFLTLVLGYLSLRVKVNRSSDEFTQEQNQEQGQSVNPVTLLQKQYATGEITEDEFEAKLDTIIDSQEIAEQVNGEAEELLEKIE